MLPPVCNLPEWRLRSFQTAHAARNGSFRLYPVSLTGQSISDLSPAALYLRPGVSFVIIWGQYNTLTGQNDICVYQFRKLLPLYFLSTCFSFLRYYSASSGTFWTSRRLLCVSVIFFMFSRTFEGIFRSSPICCAMPHTALKNGSVQQSLNAYIKLAHFF